MIFPIVTSGLWRPRVMRVSVSSRLVFAAFAACCVGIATGTAAHAQNAVLRTATNTAVNPDTLILSLDEVQRLVVLQNPGYLAARQSAVAARGALRQSRILRFNPDLGLVIPGGGANASPYEVALTQEFEWAGQRGLRVGAAKFGVAQATAEASNVGRLKLLDASSVYYRAIATEQRLRVTEEQATLTDRLLVAVRTQSAEGEISELEASLAEIEGARSRALVLAARRAVTSAMLELTQLIGVSAGQPIRLVMDSVEMPLPQVDRLAEVTDSLTAIALGRRPDVAAADAARREADVLVGLTRREAIPNLRVGAVTERDRKGGGSRVGATIGLGLPLFNRNQGLKDQRRAEAQAAAFDAQAVNLRVRAEVADAVRAYSNASEEASVFTASVLVPARENSARLETAYRAGKINLATLLLLRNQLLDAALGYWDAWFARQDAFVRLNAAIGALRADTRVAADSSSYRTP